MKNNFKLSRKRKKKYKLDLFLKYGYVHKYYFNKCEWEWLF